MHVGREGREEGREGGRGRGEEEEEEEEEGRGGDRRGLEGTGRGGEGEIQGERETEGRERVCCLCVLRLCGRQCCAVCVLAPPLLPALRVMLCRGLDVRGRFDS